MKLKITATDLLRSKVIDPEWYPTKVDKVEEGPTKAGDSTKWDVYLTIMAPPEVAGVTLVRTFSEKAPSFALEFLVACGANIEESVAAGGGEAGFDMQAAVGKTIMTKVTNELYNGQMKNRADSFRPAV